MTTSVIVLLLMVPSALAAPGSQCAPLFAGGVEYRFEETVVLDPENPGICSNAQFRCEKSELVNGPYYQLVSGSCDPVTSECEYQVRVDFKLPGNQKNLEDDSGANLYTAIWYAAETAPICYGSSCGQESVCGQAFTGTPLIDGDEVTFTATVAGRCSDIEVFDPATDYRSVGVRVCQTSSSCRKTTTVDGIALRGLDVAAELGCPPPPPPYDCERSENTCTVCMPGGVGADGGGPSSGGDGSGDGDGGGTGEGAYLRYLAGGAGAAGMPGAADWNVLLGRHWSHDYAQRIVEAPDETHVWLVTEGGSFREFGNLSAGVYETLAPSDEYRTLHYLGSGLGWELHDLDGTVTAFDDGGLWLSTTDRNGVAKTATYAAGRLDTVLFPDGRSEQFVYFGAGDPNGPEGRLASITVVGVGGAVSRTWSYTWNGDDLARIDRPDGTALEYTYDTTFAGYLSAVTLVGDDGTSNRVLRAYAYDAEGRVSSTWRGATSSGDPDAVDLWSFEYVADGHTRVADPLGRVSDRYYDTDPSSAKPRITEISGDCPSCGFAANTTFTYGDATNPLLPTQVVDGEGNSTTHSYDAVGRMLARTEAAGTAEERTTTWTYDPTYPSLVATMSRPSVEAGQSRETIYTRDASGNVTAREVRGYEAGQPFDCTASGAPCYETAMTYNAAGRVETVDPPGYATGDVTSYTYDPARGDLIADSRTDPLIGTTTYGHDGYNRRTSVTDVNGVVTETVYDALDRVVKTIQRGPDGAVETDDLITEHVYDTYGRLLRTILPEGNVIEYGYDAAGRLISIERKPDSATPAERTLYTLDAAGNRTREDLQRWDTSLADWVTESTTSYLFSSRCHVDQVLHPDGTVTEYDYDCNGNLTRTWDANHPSAGKTNPATAVYAYDALDRLTTVSRPWAGAGGGTSVTSYGYDIQDHLTAVTDPEQNTTTYSYSDRDLLTQEVSPVSGTTTHIYNPHGELTQTTDARGITTTRTVDELDRVTFVDYPDATLDTTYTYGTSPALFEVGRLTSITRDSHTVAYTYDRFGRTTQDGALTFGYDKNGNRISIGYPGGVSASYSFDYADRQKTLSVTTPAGTTDVVTAATHLPSGPLSTLTFGTGAREDRGFTSRYFPASIALTASEERSWTYTTDAVGNVTEIANCPGDLLLTDDTVTTTQVYESCQGIEAGPAFVVDTGADVEMRAATRVVLKDGFSVASGATFRANTDPALGVDPPETYTYQAPDYFLTSAAGPWGTHSWTYDKIGNRLTETDNGATDTYSYVTNGAGGNTAQLDSIALSTLGTRSYTYTSAGHVEDVTAGANVVDFTWDDAGRLAASDRSTDTAAFLYDGRSFLRQAGDAAGPGLVLPTYDSSGLLHCLQRQIPTGTTDYHVFYLAGRPVGQVALESGQPERWWYFTTDHLGTPVVATDSNQNELWVNHLDPFGEDPFAGTSSGASEQEVFLRFPGQWDDPVWRDAMMGAEGYQNVHRWYAPGTGLYTRPDPIVADRDSAFIYSGRIDRPYLYAQANPLVGSDPLGLCTLRTLYSELHRRRVDGHRRFPGEPNSFMRHCTISCESTVACGAASAPLIRLAGWGNELQGLILHDLPRLGSRLQGRTPWAFQLDDLFDNEEGLLCSGRVRRRPRCNTCEQCCESYLDLPSRVRSAPNIQLPPVLGDARR